MARWQLAVTALVQLVTVVCAQQPITAVPRQPNFALVALPFQQLNAPVDIKFADDGTVFVAEKQGRVKRFSSINDDTVGKVLLDFSINVDYQQDRGFLGMALHPKYTSGAPYIYVLYASDPGNTLKDQCADLRCTVHGRLSRFRVVGDTASQEEIMLDNHWCFEWQSHSMGSLIFGEDGSALYVSAGEGSSWWNLDDGMVGPAGYTNPCKDPPGTVSIGPPGGEGGSLRAQDILTSGDPLGYDGTILRIDPETGDGLPGNALYNSQSPSSDEGRVVAFGLRNPYRVTLRPNTNELWIGDVGWGMYEEIDVVPDVTDGQLRNYGWPCYEGDIVQPLWQPLDYKMCNDVYNNATGYQYIPPFYSYAHNEQPNPVGCSLPSSGAISGLSFYAGDANYPSDYNGALVFGDYSQRCVWAMRVDSSGQPSVTDIVTVIDQLSVASIETGPDGNIYVVDFATNLIFKLVYVSNEPIAVITATPNSGLAPLTAYFDGSKSQAANGGSLTYDWDLDGDGNFGDSTAASPVFVYSNTGRFVVSLIVTDQLGRQGNTTYNIYAFSTAEQQPEATILAPNGDQSWTVGQVVPYSGTGNAVTDILSWNIVINHCPSGLNSCHTHPLVDVQGVSNGTFVGPEHEMPTYLTITLTVTALNGLTSTAEVFIYPKAVQVTLASTPPGVNLTLGSTSQNAPFPSQAIVGVSLTAAAPVTVTLNNTNYRFAYWSDGGARIHQVTVIAAGAVTAQYVLDDGSPLPASPPVPAGGPITFAPPVPCTQSRQADGTLVCTAAGPTPGLIVAPSPKGNGAAHHLPSFHTLVVVAAFIVAYAFCGLL
eukprot:jgi/Chlat1/9081/Chrsp96S08365